MAATPDIDRAIDSIYAAALDAAGWNRALHDISAALRAAAACVFVVRNGRDLVHWTDVNLQFGQAEYRTHYLAIDPRRIFAEANPHTRLHYDRMLLSERGMDRHEFYAWQERHPDRLRYFLGCRANIDSDHSGFAAFHWPRRHGHAQADDIRLFKRIAPHLERSLQMSAHLDMLQQNRAATWSVLNELQHAIILLDSAGNIVDCNDAAHEIFAVNDGLAAVDRRLLARRADDHSMLQAVVAGAASRPPESYPAFPLRRVSGRRPYVVTVAPLPRDAHSSSPGAAALAVFIADPEERPELPETMLIRVYGLTRTEANLAGLIASGSSIDNAAGELGIAKSTARLHLQRILSKTGTHRQSELVRLLLASVAGRSKSR